MAELRHRLPLQPSSSFPSSSSADIPQRPLKRRLTTSASDTSFFAPGPATFKPSQASTSDHATRGNLNSRNNALVMAQLPAMDPSPSDPNAVFIHPPFTVFPDAHKYKDGLTYNLMALNPDWFLDPADFLSSVNDDTTAIRYPPQLEPPRGWCPSKKKDMKEGWPEGEEPRLRCTFCRRTYAGVNAKSMWRRHVYEKHKIAMSNRRDNNERRGRGSNKENKEDRVPARTSERGVRRLSALFEHEDDAKASLKARLRHRAETSDDWKNASDSSADHSNHHELPDEDEDHGLLDAPGLLDSDPLDRKLDVFQVGTSSSTPPLTPGFSPKPPIFRRPAMDRDVLESPYNPLLTPSFRHSPAHLPSEQPWRFPSPSHPLHSSARELSLCMLVRGEASPIVSGLDVSPVVLVPASARKKRSIFSSPLAPPVGKDNQASSDGEGIERTKCIAKPSPRRLFDEGILPTPATSRLQFKQHHIPESPLGRGFSAKKPRKLMSLSRASGPWRKESSLSPFKSPGKGTGLLGAFRLEGEDPFADDSFKSWIDVGSRIGDSARELSPPASSPEADSPVLRSSQLSQPDPSVGNNNIGDVDSLHAGFGLMEGFSLKDASGKKAVDDDLRFIYAGRKEGMSFASDGSPAVQAGKKTRREFLGEQLEGDDGDCEMEGSSQPKKRRRTISDRD